MKYVSQPVYDPKRGRIHYEHRQTPEGRMFVEVIVAAR